MHRRATLGFGFTSDWLKKWRENFEPITELSNAQTKQFAYYFRHSIIENRSSESICVLTLGNEQRDVEMNKEMC